jgi:hypothetical protein
MAAPAWHIVLIAVLADNLTRVTFDNVMRRRVRAMMLMKLFGRDGCFFFTTLTLQMAVTEQLFSHG